nr:MAG TPA: hypothetical protein [Caudoviricetes sp.]
MLNITDVYLCFIRLSGNDKLTKTRGWLRRASNRVKVVKYKGSLFLIPP